MGGVYTNSAQFFSVVSFKQILVSVFFFLSDSTPRSESGLSNLTSWTSNQIVWGVLLQDIYPSIYWPSFQPHFQRYTGPSGLNLVYCPKDFSSEIRDCKLTKGDLFAMPASFPVLK